MTLDERDRLRAITEAMLDPVLTAKLVTEYYRDEGRAERASREQLIFHLGILSGIVMREAERRDHDA